MKIKVIFGKIYCPFMEMSVQGISATAFIHYIIG